MTAAKEAKSNGYKSLAQLAKYSGKTVECLRYWYWNNRPLFDAVVKGFKDEAEKEKLKLEKK